MANRIERNIYILRNREPRVIEYVQGASAVPIMLYLKDYDIPEDATARVYVLKPSGKGEYDTASIKDGGILIDVKSTMFDETGTNTIQATVTLGDKTLITFSQEVEVSPNKVPGEVPESESRSNFLDEYIEKMEGCIEKLDKLPLEPGAGKKSVQQDTNGGATIPVQTKNPNAYALDNTLADTPVGASGESASVFGGAAAALGKRSHAKGTNTVAKGKYSNADGDNSVALGNASHAEGSVSVAKGNASHAEGQTTKALGDASHAEGVGTEASGKSSHTEGGNTITPVVYVSTEPASGSEEGSTGTSTKPSDWNADDHKGEHAHAEGSTAVAYGYAAHAEGGSAFAIGHFSHAEGECTQTGYTDENGNILNGRGAHSEGLRTVASGFYSHTEGQETKAKGSPSHAEGMGTIAEGVGSHAEGEKTIASGRRSHAEGVETKATKESAHAEGQQTQASGNASHSEGNNTRAIGSASHAEGLQTYAEGANSHAEGSETHASGTCSHAEGAATHAKHDFAHTEGRDTRSSADYQTVVGRYNADNPNAVFIVGAGTGDTDRKNGLEVLENGNVVFAGKLSQEGDPTEDKDLATKKYVDMALQAAIGAVDALIGEGVN